MIGFIACWGKIKQKKISESDTCEIRLKKGPRVI